MTPPRVVTVSPAQYDVIRELAHDGASNPEIADRLGKSLETVKSHISAVMGATRCRNRTSLVVALLRGRVKVQVQKYGGNR